jgi:hypothetical protein
MMALAYLSILYTILLPIMMASAYIYHLYTISYVIPLSIMMALGYISYLILFYSSSSCFCFEYIKYQITIIITTNLTWNITTNNPINLIRISLSIYIYHNHHHPRLYLFYSLSIPFTFNSSLPSINTRNYIDIHNSKLTVSTLLLLLHVTFLCLCNYSYVT